MLDYIASKHNILEHQYTRPKNVEETKYLTDITELFLRATDKYIEKGYIFSTIIQYEREQSHQEKRGRLETRTTFDDIYELTFDIEMEEITIDYKKREVFSGWNPTTGQIKIWQETIIEEHKTTVSISETKEADIRDLFRLIAEKSN